MKKVNFGVITDSPSPRITYELNKKSQFYYVLVDHNIRKNSKKEALQVKKLLTGQFVEIKNFFEEMKGNKFAIAKYKKKVIAIGLIEKSFFYPKKLLIT